MDGILQDMCDRGAFKTQMMLSCCHKKSTLAITMMKSLVIYILRDGMGRIMYCGHTHDTAERRFAAHRSAQTNDPLACPLYRYVREHGGWDGWTVYPLIVTEYDDTLVPRLPWQLEQLAIKTMKRLGHCELNHNMPVDNNDSRRTAARAWRQRNPGYMAEASRLHRARRKRTLEEMQDAEAMAQS